MAVTVRRGANYPQRLGKRQYHRDTIASEKRTLNRTARSGMHRRAAPPPQPAALSHCATLARRSRSAATTWTATRAAQSWVKLVSIARGDSIVLQSTHLDAAVLLPVLTLSRSLMCLPLVLSTVHNFCAWGCFCSPCSINIIAHSDCSVLTRAQAAPQSIDCRIDMRDIGRHLALPRGTHMHPLYVRCSSNAGRPWEPPHCALTCLESSSRDRR